MVFLLVAATGAAAGAVLFLPGIEADRARRARILAVTDGDLSDAALKALEARMDPAAAARVRRKEGPQANPPAWSDQAAGQWGTLRASLVRSLNAMSPLQDGRVRPAPRFEFRGSGSDRVRAVRCLALAIYYEAAFESPEGQAAVAQVVLNRVRDPDFPPTVCGVVFQGAHIDYSCQFTFACDGSMAWGEERGLWLRAERSARLALAGRGSSVGTATYYHADYIHPSWPDLERLGPVGRHVFYRGRGAAGEASSLSRPYRGGEPRINEARFARQRDPVPKSLDATRAAEFERSTGPRGRRNRAEDEQIERTVRSYEAQQAARRRAGG